jgi:hypothetical protein
MRCMAVHCARHLGSPAQPPRHISYNPQAALVAQADDSLQQWLVAQVAHSVAPYGKPQALAPPSAGAL